VHGTLKQRLGAFVREVRSQLGDGAEMQAAIGQHVEQHREAARGASAGDAQVGLVLGEVEHLDAVGEHARARLTQVEPAGVDLGDVRHDLGLAAPVPIDEGGEPLEQLVIREGIETE